MTEFSKSALYRVISIFWHGSEGVVINRLHISWAVGYIEYIAVCLGETTFPQDTTLNRTGNEGAGFTQVFAFEMVGRYWVSSESTVSLSFFVSSIPDQSRDAVPYLPTADVTTEEGNLQPPPPIPCFFGPITGQSRVEVSIFETFPMC